MSVAVEIGSCVEGHACLHGCQWLERLFDTSHNQSKMSAPQLRIERVWKSMQPVSQLCIRNTTARMLMRCQQGIGSQVDATRTQNAHVGHTDTI